MAVKEITSFASTVLVAGLMLMATNGIAIVAELDFVPSATDVAVSFTARSFPGGSLGTVYVTLAPLNEEVGNTLPHAALAHVTVQFTPAPFVSFVMVAENSAVSPIWTVAEAGDTLTAIGGAGADA